MPLLESIQALKVERDAVIVAHNYQSPLITAGVADFIGDSLAMARFEAGCSLAESVDADYVRFDCGGSDGWKRDPAFGGVVVQFAGANAVEIMA